MSNEGEDYIKYVNPPYWFWVMCLAGLYWYVQEAYEFYNFYIANFTTLAELPINGWFIGITAIATLSGLLGFVALLLSSLMSILLFKICVGFTFILIIIGATLSQEAPNVGYLPNEAHSVFLFFISLSSGYFANMAHRRGYATS